jgi:hypothetical protein
LIAVLGISFLTMWLLSDGGHGVLFDSFRDMAWAHNVVGGRLWSDPVLAGEPAWYAPGNPIAFGAVSRFTGASVVDVYRSSVFWWNAVLLVVVFVTASHIGGRVAGLLALPMVCLGSLWWLTHVAAPMPSIQSIMLGLLALLSWQRCVELIAFGERRGGHRRANILAVLTGTIVALTAWFHPVCAMIPAAAIGFHALFGIALPNSFAGGTRSQCNPIRRRLARALLWSAIPAALLSAPLALHFLFMPKVNPTPLQYFARELSNPDFALQTHAVLLPILGLLGAFRLARRRPVALWMVGYLVAGAVGQAAGYLHHWTRLPVPYLLPHEFQWHTQLALGILAAFAVVDAAEWLATRIPWPSDRGLRKFLWIGLMVAAVLTPAVSYISAARTYQVDVTRIESANAESIEWIRRNTSLDSVFASDTLYAHLVVAGLTGRKCVAVPIGHMNPAVDGTRRLDDLATMLSTEDEAVFVALAARYGVAHLVLKQTTPATVQHASRVSAFRCLRARHQSIAEGVMIYEVRR